MKSWKYRFSSSRNLLRDGKNHPLQSASLLNFEPLARDVRKLKTLQSSVEDCKEKKNAY